MLFVEPRFFLFFAIVLGIYWSLRSNNARKWFILLASYYFYGSWDWRFAGMLLVLSTADWYFGLRLSQTPNPRLRKVFVVASVTMNLSVLAFFKYFHFFTGSAIALAPRRALSPRRAHSQDHPSRRRQLLYLSIPQLHH